MIIPKEIPPKNLLIIKVASTIIVLSLPIFLLLSNVLFLSKSEKFHFKTYEEVGVYSTLDRAEVESATYELLKYFSKDTVLSSSFFSNQAKLHLADVKSLFDIAKIVSLMSLVLIVSSLFYLYLQNKKTQILISLKIGIILLGASVFICGVLSILNFAFFFQKFHEIFFVNNLWLFPEEDKLVQIFPQEFFVEFLKKLLVNLFISALSVLLVVKLLEKCLFHTSK